MNIEKLASAIKNDILSGIRGYHHNISLNQELLEDEIIETRLGLLKELYLKGIISINDIIYTIECIDVDCDYSSCGIENTKHFEIPQLITDYGKSGIIYIGSVDRKHDFNVVTSISEVNMLKYRKRGSNKPYVWINLTPNENGMLDCFIYNAPFLKKVTVVAVFKDPRLLDYYSCADQPDNFTFLDMLIKDKLIKEKIKYYRLLQAPVKPNTQVYE